MAKRDGIRSASETASNSTDHLPLRPVVFSILLALSEGSLHGHEVMKWVNDRLKKHAILGPGTLYRTLKELREAGLIEHAQVATAEPVDGRRQYYKLTRLGRTVLTAEARRLEALLVLDRTKALLAD